MDCFSFEASIAHEVGHVLGFTHPDQQGTRNLHLDTALVVANSSSCTHPLRHVSLSAAPREPTIMYSLTRHRVRTCLTSDDLAALHALYPTCEYADAAATPACVKPRQTVGYLRLFIATAFPFLITTVLLIGAQQLVRCHYRARLADMQREVRRLEKSCEQQTRRAAQVQAQLDDEREQHDATKAQAEQLLARVQAHAAAPSASAGASTGAARGAAATRRRSGAREPLGRTVCGVVSNRLQRCAGTPRGLSRLLGTQAQAQRPGVEARRRGSSAQLAQTDASAHRDRNAATGLMVV
jgi:hypothetical protein